MTARCRAGRTAGAPSYEEVDHATALERLRAGQIEAALLLERRPAAILRDLPNDAPLHFLSLPFEDEVAQGYRPGRFDANDYPNLIARGRHIETVAIGTVLVVAKGPGTSARQRRLARFTSRFFALFPKLQRHGDPLWAAVQPSLMVEGWRRYKPAADALQKSTSRSVDEAEPDHARLAALTRSAGPHQSPGLVAPALSMSFAPAK